MLIRAALIAATAGALTVVPVAATAATYHHSDATGDLQSLDMSSSTLTFTPAPDATEPDAKSTTISHAPHRVHVKMRFANLTKKQTTAEYVVELRTNEGKYREVDLITRPKHWHGHTTFFSARGKTNCARLAHTIDYKTDVVTFTIPRTCLSKPRWVKVAAMAVNEVVTTASDGSQPSTTAYVDDAQSPTFSLNETWSPRIHRG